MLFNSSINIVSNPIRFWMLKLEALMSRDSGWRDVSSKNGKAVLVRIIGHNYLYVSPHTKSGFIDEFSLKYQPARKPSRFWKLLDDIDTTVVRWIDRWRVKLSKTKEETKPEYTTPIPAFSSEDMTLRSRQIKKNIESLKKGKFRDKMTSLINIEPTFEIPAIQKLNETMSAQLKTQTKNMEYPEKPRKETAPSSVYKDINLDPNSFNKQW